ncbi:regulator [Streptomyces sp. SDr-06]|uniref:ATP-binding protein n=1 Tax=Streptomyces sp. SDr-06 TaxID=2267702 RepID=UPI000DE8A550|nr:AAA family ATPase [Streptomyces sp. SDr-06]RCH67146.1 regulator [Streptomyces sp. SDr-06]
MRSHLPAELNRFIGRDRELDRLGRLLSEGRMVTVTGVGGVGKTRFALRAAATAVEQERYCDGVRLVELSALTDPGLLDHAVVEALGLTDHTARPPRRLLLDHLGERRVLLVVDGFEQLVDACAGLLRELLRGCPGLSVLAAGRLPLRIDGERVFPLAPLNDEDALRLFTERGADARGGERLAEEHEEAAAELCRRLDGIPLALELAAGRLGTLSVEQLLYRLDDRFRLLTGGGRAALPRHQTLRTTIGWSHELCTPAQRLLWARLSVFAGSFDLEAVEYICVGPDLPQDEVLDVLGELIDQSLVVRDDGPCGVRYRLLDTVRAYGAEWLTGTGDADRLHRRHRDWYLGLATWCELDWFSPRQAEVAVRVESELANLRAAMEFSLGCPEDTHLAQHLAGTLWFYWAGCGRLAEGRHWLAQVLDVESEHDRSRLKALWVLGYVAVLQGDAVAAIAALQECREEAESLGDAVAAAYAVHRTGCLALVTDDMPRAEELLRTALRGYDEVGELNCNVLMGQVEMAMAVGFRGRLDEAVSVCEQVVRVCEDHGERWARAYALYVLAYAAWHGGDPDRARGLLRETLAVSHAFHDLVGTVLTLEMLALVEVDTGDPAEAAVLQGAAERIWPSVGLPLFGSAYFYAAHVLCEERTRARLGDVAYEEHRRGGTRLDTAAAVARALGHEGGGVRELTAAVEGQPHEGPGHTEARRLPLHAERGDGGLKR